MRQEDRSKIGVSNNPERRASEVSFNSGLLTTVVYRYEAKNRKKAYSIENFLHNHFSESRLIGEFFREINIDDFKSATQSFFEKEEEDIYLYYWGWGRFDAPITKRLKSDYPDDMVKSAFLTEEEAENNAIKGLLSSAEQFKRRAEKFITESKYIDGNTTH